MAASDGAPPEPLPDQRALFELDPDVAYFNTANLSPVLSAARAAGDAALAQRAAPWTIANADWFTDVEALRERFARLVNGSPESVALVPATSYGLAVVERNLNAAPHQRVLVLDAEYPSNHYTWRRFCRRTGSELVVVAREGGQGWAEAVLAELDERAAVVAVPNVHWTDGSLVEVGPVADAAHELGASLVIDASQSLGAMPLDVARLRPTAMVAAGYKWLLGPFALSYLYLDERLHDGEPLEENWILRAGSEDFSRLVDYRDEYLPGARRFDMGQRTNFQLTPMAVASLEQLLEWRPERIAATLRSRTAAIAAGAREHGYEAPGDGARGPHMLGLPVPGDAAERIRAALADAGVVAALRGPALRISPHLHTSDGDVERLLGALAAAA
jgi:selenocysteine lyase/cysteine desulfurase